MSKILPLPKLIEYFNLLFMFKYINSSLPVSFYNTWIRNEERRNQNNYQRLRNTNEFFIPANRFSTTDLFPLTNYSKKFGMPSLLMCRNFMLAIMDIKLYLKIIILMAFLPILFAIDCSAHLAIYSLFKLYTFMFKLSAVKA
jgi:hypothetical protein